MAFDELDRKRIELKMAAYLERKRPPAHIRPQLDIGFRLNEQSVVVFEIRPDWKEPKIKRETDVAKATYVRTQNVWKIYWMRADLKWHGYEPMREAASVEEFLDELEKDPYCCFWG